jgi:1,2-diacylglycerol 3-beta-galactosyltransferase
MRVLVLGFVTNMAELMSACDVIITKAGPGTIMEALICGLPMVLNAFVPCQEEGNIPYVVDNKVGGWVAGLLVEKKWFY